MKRRHIIVAGTISIGTIVTLLLAAWFTAHTPFGPGIEDFSVKLAGEYGLYRNSAHDISISPEVWNSTTPVIPTKVIECAVDRHLILAKRQGLKQRNAFPNDTYEEPAPGVFDYWILDTNVPKVFGPMTLSQFNSKRKELGVPESITLKDVYAYRPSTIWR